MGQNVRTYEIMKHLHNSGFTIDYFSLENFCSDGDFSNFDELNSENLVRNLYLYDYKEVTSYKNREDHESNPLDWVTPNMAAKFKNILSVNEYDYIVVIYAYMANLLKNFETSARKIEFVEDFLTVAHYVRDGYMDFGGLFTNEIGVSEYFDDLLYISHDEKILFEKFHADKNHYYLPHFLKKGTLTNQEKDIDLFFIGHDNPYNIIGIQWFFEHVYPYMNKDIRIHIAGKVTSHISISYENITMSGFVEDLADMYNRTKISMCPLLSGTGQKIKVVEAMSYGIPIVCTARGVDGFPDKNHNGCLVTDDPKKFAKYINDLHNDKSLYKEKAREVADYFNKFFSYERNIPVLNRVFGIYPKRAYFTDKTPEVNGLAVAGRMLNVAQEGIKAEGGARTKGKYRTTVENVPLISIITVVFNGAKKLERTIQSVLGQSYPNIEYIIIDGGSTDGSVEIIEKYADQIDYYVSQKDDGIYDAMNKGVALCFGEYIGVVNSDDIMLKDGVYDAITEILRNNADYVAAQDYCVDRDGNFVGDYLVSHIDERCLVARNPCNHGAMLIGKNVYDKIGYYDIKYRYAADYKFQAAVCVDKQFKGCKLHKNIHYFEMAGASITQREESLREVGEIIAEFVPDIDNRQLQSLISFMHEFNISDEIWSDLEKLIESGVYTNLQEEFLVSEMVKYGYSGKYAVIHVSQKTEEITEVNTVTVTKSVILGRTITLKKLVKYALPYGVVRFIQVKRYGW